MFANAIVRIYRLIPFRGLLHPWFPTPTSHLYKPGDGFSGIFSQVGDSKVPRPPMPD